MQFLYEHFDSVSKMGLLPKELPIAIGDNINKKLAPREYQKEAFARFFYYINSYPEKKYPTHVAFNMATGSGKTLIMAGCMLGLYEKGYRNFLFFVHSNNIIEKTKANFLNATSKKYLFADKVMINGKLVRINSVENFDGASSDDINIKFTTIQKLHGDLQENKEGAITYEDFEDKKIVLIADEAHHIQAETKSSLNKEESEAKESWENTVKTILFSNRDNILLEFTATLLDDGNDDVFKKYEDKLIYRYDIKEFVGDKYSKDIYTFASKSSEKERILQAIILSQYRQAVANKYQINLKPVVLFKAQKTIAQSEENHAFFNELIEKLSVKDIEKVQKSCKDPIIQDAFAFFKEQNITSTKLVTQLKDGFSPGKCLNANNEAEVGANQIILNSLEDKNNSIRAIFAVQKLNEGWDVLNLFDIVRLYHSRDAKDNKPGKTTISEAQLIGRGARYFPFPYDEQDKHKRKFDDQVDHELSILERMHYHCFNDHRYVSEIKKALREKGWNIDEDYVDKELKLKKSFKESSFFKSGMIYLNKRKVREKKNISSFEDLGVVQKNFSVVLTDGSVISEKVFGEDKKNTPEGTTKVIAIKDIEPHLVKNAIAKNAYLTFELLHNTFDGLTSIDEFITSEQYVGGLSLDVQNYTEEGFGPKAKLNALIDLFAQIEAELKGAITEYQGSEGFTPHKLSEVFKDVSLHLHKKKNEQRIQNDLRDFVEDRDWYGFNALYGTSEEVALVKFIDTELDAMKEKFEDIYLLRNEGHFKIYNFKDGLAFEPDFVLFTRQKNGKEVTYQVFIEPKGQHLMLTDEWKEDFLQEIRSKFGNQVLTFEKKGKYTITGVPFYNTERENEFREEFYNSVT